MSSKKPSTKKKIYSHSPSELSIQTKFIKKLKKENPGAFIIKLADKFFSGLPDVFMVKDGKAVFFELKTNKGVVSEIQKQTHTMLREAGAVVNIVRGGE